MVLLSVKEEVFGASHTNYLDVPIESYRITLAELIQSKVAAKVFAVNEGMDDWLRPASNFLSEEERRLNKNLVEQREEKRRKAMKELKLDAEQAGYEALAGFQRNAFFVIVDGTQKTDLEEELQLSEYSQVQFIRLMPLVGG
jgi:hypothetical protein